MFDLFRSRTKSVRYLLGGLLSLVALSMVVTLIPGFGTPSNPNRDILATIGDTELTSQQIHRALSIQMRDGKVTRDSIKYTLPQMVNQMIAEFATMYEAQRMGLTATDAEVVDQIRALMPQMFPDGKFVGGQVYRGFLEANGMTVNEFESNVRKQIILRKLQAVAFEGEVVSPAEVEAEFRRRNAKVNMKIVQFSPEEFSPQVSVPKAEMEDFLAKNSARFQTPPKRAFDLIVVDEQKLGETIPVSDAALLQSYNEQKERWRSEERAKVRHILIKATEAADKPAAKKKAEDILKQLKGGADFAELAKKNSDDPGSKERGGDLDWVTKGQTVPNFEKTAFSLKPKEISPLVETEFGFHIIQTLEKEAGRVKTFDEVKGDLATEVRRRQLFEKMPALADQARAELLKTPKQAQAIAAKLNLNYVHVERAGFGDPLPLIGVSQEFDRVIYSATVGSVTDVIQLPGNKLVIGVVDQIFPPQPAKLADVEPQIKSMLQQQKAAVMAEAKLREFENKLKANNRDILKAAKEMNLKVVESGDVSRTDDIKGIGSPMIFGEILFTHPAGFVVGPYRVAQRTFFYQVAGRKEADMAELPIQRETIVTTLRGQKSQSRRELFEDGLVQALTKQGKIKVSQDAMKRLLAAYGAA
jgi:peptidyl-prolyl cis-trans isomerase D